MNKACTFFLLYITIAQPQTTLLVIVKTHTDAQITGRELSAIIKHVFLINC